MSDTYFYGALPVGHDLHEYFIEKVLGQGGFGITYLAHDANLNKKVAIKEYLPEHFAVREAGNHVRAKGGAREDFAWGLKRFLQEAQTLARFQHANIVPVLRFFEMNGTAYMVMSYQHGEGLGIILDRHRVLEESELEEVLFPLLDGLRLVHEAGILHRDIKPDNIFIRDDATPVLLDFGAARHAMGERGKNVTRIITPNYAPPEQYYSDGRQGPWTDIYALAAVIYEAIAGAPPPEAPGRLSNDRMRALERVGHGHYRPAFLRAIDHGLALAPADRPQSIAEWILEFPRPLVPGLAAVRNRAALSRGLGTTERQAGREPVAEEPAVPPPEGTGAADGKVAAIPEAARGRPKAALARPLRWLATGLVLFIMAGAAVSALVLAGVLSSGDAGRSVPRDGEIVIAGEPVEGSLGADAPEGGAEADEGAQSARTQRHAGLRRFFAGHRAFVTLPPDSASHVLEFRANGRLVRRSLDSNVVGGWSIRGRNLCLNMPDRLPAGNECFRITRIAAARGGKRAFAGRGRTGSIRGEIHY